MANVEIAAVCNLHCPYCFAADHMQNVSDRATSAFISLQQFEQRLDFLDRSGINQIRFIGGEPTLHPQFAELIGRARRRGKQIVLFSHGLIPEHALVALESLTPDECIVMINANAMGAMDGPTPQEERRRGQTIRRLGPRVLLGFNIYRTNFQLDFLLPLILQWGCRRSIRVGLAHPTLSGQNEYLHPKEYPIAGRKLVDFCQAAAEMGITLELDCGFVRCMFSDEDIECLRQARADIGWRCNPILDLSIQGQAIHCFPLSGWLERPFENAGTATALRHELTIQASAYRIAGVYRECSTCAYKQSGDCSGGGLEHTRRRFRHTPFRLAMPAAPLNAADPEQRTVLAG
jgi:hypothetical protein